MNTQTDDETTGNGGSRCAPATGSGLVAIGNVGRFRPIKPGKIHLKCRRCTNTRSNMARSDFDPVGAVVIVLNYCPRCDRGGEFESVEYYDAAGSEIVDSQNALDQTFRAVAHKAAPPRL